MANGDVPECQAHILSAMRWSAAQGLAAWLGTSAVGAAILVAPAHGDRLISLSAGHGPSAQDMLAVGLLAIGWTTFLIPMYTASKHLRWLWPLAAAGAAGGLLAEWSLATDSGTWWLLGVAVMVAVQLVAALTAIKTQRLAPPLCPRR